MKPLQNIMKATMAVTLILLIGCRKNDDNSDRNYLASLSCFVNNEMTKLSSSRHNDGSISFNWVDGDEILLVSASVNYQDTYRYSYSSSDNLFHPCESSAPVIDEGYYAAYNPLYLHSSGIQPEYEYDGHSRVKLRIADMGIGYNPIDENHIPKGIVMISNLSRENCFVFEHLKGLLKINLNGLYGGNITEMGFQKKEPFFSNRVLVYPDDKTMVEDPYGVVGFKFTIYCNNELSSDYSSYYLDIRPGEYDGFMLSVNVIKNGYGYTMTKDIASGGTPLSIQRGMITNTPNLTFVPDNLYAPNVSSTFGYPNFKRQLSIASYDESEVTPVWSSSNSNVAEVSSSGLVSIKADPGSNDPIIISADCGNSNIIDIELRCHPVLHVRNDDLDDGINPPHSPTTYGYGESFSKSLSHGKYTSWLSALAAGTQIGGYCYSNGETIEWSSSNPQVATIEVNNSSLSQGIAEGTFADITPKSQGSTVIRYTVKKDGVILYEHLVHLSIL